MQKAPLANNRVDCERQEPLMTWAVRADDSRRAIHIAMLTAQENGLGCRCLCYSCGDHLRAINVGKPASHFDKPGTQRPHFKHERGADRKCLSAVARMVALQHFIEQNEIYLPPRRRPARKELPTGHLLETEAITPASTAQVAERKWIDNQSVILVLSDGRELVVTVRTTHSLNTEGTSHSVLSFSGLKNPDVAGWSSERILEHLRLPGWASWDRHWDDNALDGSAEEQLCDQEDRFLSDIPREWLNDLDGKMASETILHWLIKRAIQSYNRLKVPGVRQTLSRPMPDGSVAHEVAEYPAHTLQLQAVTFERRLGNIVPDVICWAKRIDSKESPYQLLVEAAVTHYVTEEKQERIVQSGLACIEIRANLFSQAGNISVKEIERMVSSDEAIKAWIVHPHLMTELENASQRLTEKARIIQRRLDEEEAMKRKRKEDKERLDRWYEEASDLMLAKGYFKALYAIWTGKPARTVGEIKVEPDDLWRAVTARKLAHGSRHGLESKDGALNLIRRISALKSGRHTSHAIDIALEASHVGWQGAPFAILALFALKTYHSYDILTSDAEFLGLETQIQTSLERGDSIFVRTTDYDPLLMLLFPAMAELLKSPFGTRQELDAQLAVKAAERSRTQEVDDRRRRRKQAVANGRAAQEMKSFRDALRVEIDFFASKSRWVRTILGPEQAEKLHGLYGAQVKLSGLNSMTVIKSALDYKSRGQSIKSMLQSLPFQDAGDIRKSLRLLHIARICVVTDETP